MKLSELPAQDLIRAFRATESSTAPDPYARKTLREEIDRRLLAATGTTTDEEDRQ